MNKDLSQQAAEKIYANFSLQYMSKESIATIIRETVEQPLRDNWALEKRLRILYYDQLDDYRRRFGSEAAQEKCVKCGQYWCPSLVESGWCIFCICKDKSAQLTATRKALEELAEKVDNALNSATGHEMVDCMERHVRPKLTTAQQLLKGDKQ